MIDKFILILELTTYNITWIMLDANVVIVRTTFVKWRQHIRCCALLILNFITLVFFFFLNFIFKVTIISVSC